MRDRLFAYVWIRRQEDASLMMKIRKLFLATPLDLSETYLTKW